MRWFKHLSDSRHNPKIRAAEKRLGEAGYARVHKMFEIIAAYGGQPDKFQPIIDLRKPTTDLNWLADEWKISPEEATKTLDIFAEVLLIDPKALSRKLVKVPQMLEYLDEWTERRQRGKTPERLPSDSGATRVRSRSRVEIEAEEEKSVATAAASFEEKAKSEEWKSIRITPVGSPEFQSIWAEAYHKSPSTMSLVGRMERAIQICNSRDIQIPPPFYAAKRAVEKQESAAEGRLPRLVPWEDPKTLSQEPPQVIETADSAKAS